MYGLIFSITVAHSQSLLEKIDIIDNISDYMIKAHKWGSGICPFTGFVEDPYWEHIHIQVVLSLMLIKGKFIIPIVR